MNPARGWAFGSPAFSWLTSQRGWLLTGEGGAAGSVPNDLYRTTDAGLHWRLVSYNHLMNSSPHALAACDGFGGISFRTVDEGCAAGGDITM